MQIFPVGLCLLCFFFMAGQVARKSVKNRCFVPVMHFFPKGMEMWEAKARFLAGIKIIYLLRRPCEINDLRDKELIMSVWRYLFASGLKW